MASAFSPQAMLRLYRSVLRVHKRVLPQEMKQLGDKYARNEFKAHKGAKIGQVKQFAQQWKEYVISLEIQASRGSFGKNIDERKLQAMTEEQLTNFRQLEEEARKIGGRDDRRA